jgi:hypothetical protein
MSGLLDLVGALATLLSLFYSAKGMELAFA